MGNKSLRTDDEIEDVLKKYSDTVYRIAFSQMKNKADAEDIFQDVFMRYMKCNVKFESETHLKAWLIRVSINCSKNLLTSAWFRKTTTFDDNLSDVIPETYQVYDTVLELPEKYRIVIHLHYYEDMSISDIAKAINKNENTVKTRLFRARKILMEKLKGDFLDV